jgi:hypothetical protein
LCALGFGYVLSSAVFLAEVFVKWVAKWQNWEVEWCSKAMEMWIENSDGAVTT